MAPGRNAFICQGKFSELLTISFDKTNKYTDQPFHMEILGQLYCSSKGSVLVGLNNKMTLQIIRMWEVPFKTLNEESSEIKKDKVKI